MKYDRLHLHHFHFDKRSREYNIIDIIFIFYRKIKWISGIIIKSDFYLTVSLVMSENFEKSFMELIFLVQLTSAKTVTNIIKKVIIFFIYVFTSTKAIKINLQIYH